MTWRHRPRGLHASGGRPLPTGGSGFTILVSVLPWLACCALHEASRQALTTLVGSQIVVQLLKRTIVRGRPAEVCDLEATIREPDRFSFPSGHATASMAVALAYGAAFPLLAAPLLLLAILVGFSRYPPRRSLPQ